MSAQSLLHSVKDFAAATDKGSKLVKKGAATQVEVDAALASHSSNPVNVKTAPAAPATSAPAAAPSVAAPAATNGVMPTDKEGLLKYLVAHPDKVTEVSVALSRLSTPGALDVGSFLNVNAIAALPTRSLGSKGNSGWYVGGKCMIGGKRCQVSVNATILKDK